jgi:hypothetical protein
MRWSLVVAVLLVCAGISIPSSAQTLTFKSFTPDGRHINISSGDASVDGMGELLAQTLKTAYPNTYRPDVDRVYVVVHVLRWTDPVTPMPARAGDALPAPIQQVQFSRWYVYSNDRNWSADDFQKTQRVFGVTKLWLTAVHLNLYAKDQNAIAAREESYRATYALKAVAKEPIALQRFAQLASLFPGLSSVAAPGGAEPIQPGKRISMWGATQVSVPNPSDLTFTPALEEDDDGRKGVPLGDETKFDNEGRSMIDFGIAVPIRSATELKADEAGGPAVPKVVSKSNAFATFDLYLKPVDVKAPGLKRVPHLLVGVSITSKPSENFFVGVGWGPAIANFFGAYQWTKVKPENGEPDFWDRRAIVGVELPIVMTLISKLK